MFELKDNFSDIYLANEEKAKRLSKEIITMLKAEHVSMSETRSLFSSIIYKLENEPM